MSDPSFEVLTKRGRCLLSYSDKDKDKHKHKDKDKDKDREKVLKRPNIQLLEYPIPLSVCLPVTQKVSRFSGSSWSRKGAAKF